MNDNTLDTLQARVSDGSWWVYLVRCADGTLYAGCTADLARRLRQHNGQVTGGARYTRGRRPVALAWCEAVPDRSAALVREAAIKRLSRGSKERLINDD